MNFSSIGIVDSERALIGSSAGTTGTTESSATKLGASGSGSGEERASHYFDLMVIQETDEQTWW